MNIEKEEFSNDKNIPNYITAKFNCNEYFLMGNLLAYSYKFSDKDGFYYQNADATEQNNIDEFMQIAKEFPELQTLINYATDFDKQPSNEARNIFANNMTKRLEMLTTIRNDEDFIQVEGKKVKDAFEKLKNTEFYKSMLKKTIKHQEDLRTKFENYKQIANEALEPILQNLDKKEIETVVLPPQLFGDPYAIKTQGEQVTTLASYPEEFNKNIPNLDVVSMIHEIMHTYIPVDESIKFDNAVQEDVYKVVNHCLVELSANGELGIKIANLGDYFKTPMHQEILRNRKTGEIFRKEDYIRAGISFSKELEFESLTDGFKGSKVITGKDELSNDKIRAMVYPYFLAFKNKNEKNPKQSILSDINRDKEAITDIYGQKFYKKLENQEYLDKVLHDIENTANIIELNDVIAKDALGIEIHKNKTQQKFEESNLQSDLYELSTEATISGFNEMSKNVRDLEKSNKQEQILESERIWYRK